jgi:type VI secretion system protein ImpJ
MTGNHRIAWRQGMFLRPQHFQAQDRHIDSLVMARVHSVRPWAWGFTELTIDEDMASLGKFSAVRASGVMPDGTAFSIPDSMPPPEPLDVPDDARDALISLTLPARQPGALEFREAGERAVDARFLVQESEVADSFSDERETEPLELGIPNLRFGVTRDQTYGRVTLGIARVREVRNKKLLFDDRYIPPTLDVDASTRLCGALTDMLGRDGRRARDPDPQ